ncbi:MAG: uroporphyrinogen decarboxylase [Parcubacteria group bacterium Gr01-1014_56]|nr:MAG: uroporphyrinogen decarboxylase [Parcubacteria group bacterium Gr01-1014_56]
MNDSIFLKACRGERVERIPVWFMRQAGRSLPGYRKLRETHDVLSLTQTPELAAEVSMEPVELLGVDAAILFADIMLLPIAMGVDVKIVERVGPVIDDPIDTPDKVLRLQAFAPNQIDYLQETIRILRNKLSVPLIGFSGAPFTLASYLIEGEPSRTWLKTKRFMLEHPESWEQLMSTLSEGIIEYLRTQIRAGAQAVQIFDSWVGALSPKQYRAQVLPHMQHIFASLKNEKVPRLHFGTNTAGILDDFSNVDCEVIGVDWRVSLGEVKKRIGSKSLQGNLDPAVLLAPWETLTQTVDHMLAEINPKKGYIFNLGHGMPPQADNAVVKKLVEYVHSK